MLLLILALISTSHAAHIFAGAFLGGSHLTAIYEATLILAEAGHKVTFLNVVAGERNKITKHPNIDVIDVIMWTDQDKDMMWKECVSELLAANSVSGDPTKAFGPGCMKVWTEVWKRSAEAATSETVLKLFRENNFDLIMGEKVEFNGMALLGTVTNVPVVNYEPSFMVGFSVNHNNLPMLGNSQPSLTFSDFDKPPSFAERFAGLKKMLSFVPFMQTGQNAMQPFLEKHGYSLIEDVADSVKLFLTNDHPAFTFPFLRPPNDIPIGCANLLGSKEAPLNLSPEISKFLDESEGKDVVYVSFGSYVKSSEVSWYLDLIDILTEQDLRVIVKVDKSSDKKFPKSVLPLTWAPQKDLLRSGKIKFFVSHCGNNGRLEAMFYNVPVLCVPQFADQPVCAEIIRWNGFGNKLFKEDIKTKGKEMISTMISNHGIYLENMKRASDIVENEPGNVKENLIFYVEYLAKYKNVDYLVNKVIKQQSIIQIYNLDIIVPVCLICLALVILVLHLLIKLCVYVFRKLTGSLHKKKSE